MTALLFEKFWLLLIVCAMLWIIPAAISYQRRSRLWFRVMLICTIVFAALLAMNLLVETDREGIAKSLDKLIRACEEADMITFETLIAEDFEADGMNKMNKEEIVSAAETMFGSFEINVIGMPNTEIVPPQVGLVVFAQISTGSRPGDMGTVRSKWKLRFAKSQAGWQLMWVKPVTIQNQSIESIRELMNMH